ncbi:MAG: HD-GYP domain-containing protein [Bacillota bacterium]
MHKVKTTLQYDAGRIVAQALMDALGAKDALTRSHSERLEKLLVNVAQAMELPQLNVPRLKLLARYHDIGKIGIPPEILLKPGPLDPGERARIELHCRIGQQIALLVPELSSIADLILTHHEWWNGMGYPLHLVGDQIPVECRLLGILDAFDAMTNDRPYRKAMPPEQALAELQRFAGIQFDPDLVTQFIFIWRGSLGSHGSGWYNSRSSS